ncbi:MAG: zf-HC2 domain-containing protein [Clostridium sp.]|nr:zf-HC2 domain-containing protein [Clostridium sp.]
MTNIICKKVSSMLSLYIDNKVTYQERAFIEDHLGNCDECYKKYLYLKSLIKNLKDSYKQVLELAKKKQQKVSFSIREHEKFMDNLSPYVDNELDSQECFEFRKYLMKSKMAQKELKNTYIMQKEMRNAFDRTKKKMNFDSSKYVINSIKNKKVIKLPESKILEMISNFHPKTAKIAILTGLVVFSAIEAKNLNLPVKIKEQQRILKHFDNSSIEEPVKNLYRNKYYSLKKFFETNP